MAHQTPNVPGLAPGATSATGEANLRHLAKSTDELRKAALVNTYPRYVRKNGAKILVDNEAEHRAEVPGDFAKPAPAPSPSPSKFDK